MVETLGPCVSRPGDPDSLWWSSQAAESIGEFRGFMIVIKPHYVGVPRNVVSMPMTFGQIFVG